MRDLTSFYQYVFRYFIKIGRCKVRCFLANFHNIYFYNGRGFSQGHSYTWYLWWIFDLEIYDN